MVGAMSLLHRQNGQFMNPRTIAEERKAIPLDIEQRMTVDVPATAEEAASVDLSTPKTVFASSVSQKQIPHRVVAEQMGQNLFLPAKQSLPGNRYLIALLQSKWDRTYFYQQSNSLPGNRYLIVLLQSK